MEKVVFPIIASIGCLALLFLYLAGHGYQSGTWSLQQAFAILTYSAYAGLGGTGAVIFYILWRRVTGLPLLILFISGLLGLTAFYLPYRQQQVARQVPPIHDITTDMVDPPAFVDIVPLRQNASNPASYAGEETAALQRQAYPDIVTRLYATPPEQVFAAALAEVERFGWELVAAIPEEGRIEATSTTRWFGFKDDVVIRIRPGGAEGFAVLDMRSKSRVGRSDIGVNANRIRVFVAALERRLM